MLEVATGRSAMFLFGGSTGKSQLGFVFVGKSTNEEVTRRHLSPSADLKSKGIAGQTRAYLKMGAPD